MNLRKLLRCPTCGKGFDKLRFLNSHIKVKQHGNKISMLEALIGLGFSVKTSMSLIEYIKVEPL